MKNYISLIALLTCFISCKENRKKEDSKRPAVAIEKINASNYPEMLQKVFDAHGGLALWRKQRTLTYVIPKGDNPETHSTDLYSRKDKIETPDYIMGFDGHQPWLLNKEKDYEGNVEFYHNLMFYFYAMPFVLGDSGIHYDTTDDLIFEGVNYPGIRISYDDGIGTSPKDEYFIHYDKETYQMAWLGYTVTYRSGEKSENVKWIRYDNWATINGLILPKSISWYTYEGRNIKDLRNTVDFENITVSEQPKPLDFYAKPDEARYWEKPKDQ